MSRFDLNFEEKIISISLGSYHSLALTSNNRIFAWGRNDNYQVEESLSNFNNLVPKEITNTVNLKEYGDIYFLKARADNSAILTSKGHVLVWGDNSGGQIGDSTTKDRSKPHVITFNQPSD
jgi:alpha-tubulin suppressor-like RCC1 family protein